MKLMKDEQTRRLLDQIGVLRDPCDLDLLVFFVRHPRVLLTSDQIAAFLGYEVKRLGESLDVLVTAALLTRMQTPTSAARMHVFAVGGPHDGWLPSLVEVASTREGRLALRAALIDQRNEQAPGPVAGRDRD
ncbi:MAG: hypothetical protein ABJA98_33010 [Acidobacteriota bacterium]